MLKFKMREKSGNGIGGLLISSLIALFSVAVFSFAFALITASAENPSERMGLYSLAALIASGIFSGVLTCRLYGTCRAMLSALLTVLVMMLIGIIISSGKLSGAAFMNYASFIGTFTVGAYLGRPRDKRHKRHKRRG